MMYTISHSSTTTPAIIHTLCKSMTRWKGWISATNDYRWTVRSRSHVGFLGPQPKPSTKTMENECKSMLDKNNTTSMPKGEKRDPKWEPIAPKDSHIIFKEATKESQKRANYGPTGFSEAWGATWRPLSVVPLVEV